MPSRRFSDQLRTTRRRFLKRSAGRAPCLAPAGRASPPRRRAGPPLPPAADARAPGDSAPAGRASIRGLSLSGSAQAQPPHTNVCSGNRVSHGVPSNILIENSQQGSTATTGALGWFRRAPRAHSRPTCPPSRSRDALAAPRSPSRPNPTPWGERNRQGTAGAGVASERGGGPTHPASATRPRAPPSLYFARAPPPDICRVVRERGEVRCDPS